ncbi:unnamed protein product [Protopolystoma xenopodis]|uniref:Uncharacterized protein n=1 Tax=Protopolystoma xenopodis TaxID=117903 RepID=A0A3S5BG71_9PLAT|nr:unnamed protein product [Protopolystoma xenopodis]
MMEGEASTGQLRVEKSIQMQRVPIGFVNAITAFGTFALLLLLIQVHRFVFVGPSEKVGVSRGFQTRRTRKTDSSSTPREAGRLPCSTG